MGVWSHGVGSESVSFYDIHALSVSGMILNMSFCRILGGLRLDVEGTGWEEFNWIEIYPPVGLMLPNVGFAIHVKILFLGGDGMTPP